MTARSTSWAHEVGVWAVRGVAETRLLPWPGLCIAAEMGITSFVCLCLFHSDTDITTDSGASTVYDSMRECEALFRAAIFRTRC